MLTGLWSNLFPVSPFLKMGVASSILGSQEIHQKGCKYARVFHHWTFFILEENLTILLKL